jgi:hypothetical protein
MPKLATKFFVLMGFPDFIEQQDLRYIGWVLIFLALRMLFGQVFEGLGWSITASGLSKLASTEQTLRASPRRGQEFIQYIWTSRD